MIGISQLQFPSKNSSRLKLACYFGDFIALSILVNPVNAFLSFSTIFFRAEIKTFYIYKEIKDAKREKITKKDYWKIFFRNNMIKLISFSLFSALVTYLIFTTTFLLVSLLATMPLTMVLILLQSELRPKDFNPVTLFKASISFFLEGVKENIRAMVNKFDNAYEHLLPHQLNDDIIKNIDRLKNKYSEEISQDVINSDQYVQFIQYIDNSYEISDENKGKVITFLNDFCSNDQKHSSVLTGGQILLLVLRACNDGNREAVKSKKDALIANLIDTQVFSRKERIPNTCFTGVIYRMLSTLEGMHPDPEIKFTPPKQILLSEAQNEVRWFMLDKSKKKKNNKEIFYAWYKVQNNPDDNSQKIVDDFVLEIRIPLIRKLLNFSSGYTEQVVLTLMKNICSIKLNRLVNNDLISHITRETNIKCCLIDFKLGDEYVTNLLELIKERVFLELLNKDLLKMNFSLKDSSLNEAKKIADTIIKKEVEEFELKAEKIIENRINGKIDILLSLMQEKIQVYYRVLMESGYHDFTPARKEQIDSILNNKLQITAEEAPKELLKSKIKTVYKSGNVTQLYEKVKEIKTEFIENGPLATQEIDEIVKERIITLNNEAGIIPSSNLSHSLSVSNLAAHHL